MQGNGVNACLATQVLLFLIQTCSTTPAILVMPCAVTLCRPRPLPPWFEQTDLACSANHLKKQTSVSIHEH
jgi:hypothetical protein